MYTLLSTSPAIKNFRKTEPEPCINIPIRIGIAKQKFEPYIPDLFFDQGERLKREEKWFNDVEEKILHGPEVKTLADIKARERYRASLDWMWEKRAFENRTLWSRNLDGRHIEPAQIWYTKNNQKRIIPAREILDDNYGKNKKRNDTIEKIRDKFLRRYKTGRGNYENTGNYYYKSRYHKELFLEIVQTLGLERKAETKKRTVEIQALDTSGFTSKEIADLSNRYQEDEL